VLVFNISLQVAVNSTDAVQHRQVVYGCETWYVTVKDEQRLCVFQKKVLKKICGPNRDRLTGDWKKLWVGPVTCMRDD